MQVTGIYLLPQRPGALESSDEMPTLRNKFLILRLLPCLQVLKLGLTAVSAASDDADNVRNLEEGWAQLGRGRNASHVS